MALPTVEGTKLRNGRYYLNLRIPAEAAASFPGKTHLRDSLKTSDEKIAKRGVILAKAKLIEAAEDLRQQEMQTEAIAALPPDQRALFDEAGGTTRLHAQFAATDKARAFLIAGGALTESELQGAQPLIGEKLMAEAAHKAELVALDRIADVEAKTLRALGQKVNSPANFGLRELIAALAPLTGVRGDTVALQNRIATRFIQYHGDLPLSELTVAHLREFAEAYRDLPANLRSPTLRDMTFRDLTRVTKAQNQPRITNTTRKQHIDTLKGLLSKAPSQGYIASDPWAQFNLIVPTGKHSAAKVKRRLPFSGEQVKLVLADAAKYAATSIDRWGPLLAAYLGARIEEIAQLRSSDVFLEDGIWCIQITDEGEDQKVKNESSVRRLPLHQKIIDDGFIKFAEERPDDEFLFENDSGKSLKPMKPNKKGRLAPAFGKRFGTRLRQELKIIDKRFTFHSFRHRWEDAAEETDMPQTHRRDLAGRSKNDDSQAAYGEGPRMIALKRSLDRIDPQAI